MSVFSGRPDFDAFHQHTGEVCPYADMKSVMLHGLVIEGDGTWLAIPGLDIDASWLDFGGAGSDRRISGRYRGCGILSA
ncbi:hypothetical protein [Pontibacter virosus]|uniref:hypothetical protein n=1 Tax=Pontibacter virosus TaxID=1765052 RepID=UPI001057AB0C|nr:hypothetical protein [Pontibacter virosus]